MLSKAMIQLRHPARMFQSTFQMGKLTSVPVRNFCKNNNQHQGVGNKRSHPLEPPDPTDTSAYGDEEDEASFESDRKFSNFILFTGAFALMVIYGYSSVMNVKKAKEQKV